jgi:hypothetical protein
MEDVDQPGSEPEIEEMMEELRRRAEKLGLYMQDASIVTSDADVAKRAAAHNVTIRDAMEAGAEFMAIGVFIIGDQAFSNRVIHPEQYEVDKTVQTMLPTEAEAMKERLTEKLSSTDDILSIFDDDEGEDDNPSGS